jgi:CP family cyanate transporter-like MFS transporter
MAGLFCGTIIIGIGLGIAGSVILGIVKQAIPTHLPEVMSAYTACVSLGTAIGSGAAVPIARLLEGWQAGLMFWALPMLLSTILWACTMHRRQNIHGGQSTMRAPMLPLLKKRSARMVTLYYLFRVASSWLLVVWLVTLLHQRGMSTEKAGLLLSLTTACQIPCALISGLAIRWLGSIQRLMTIATLLAVAACWGLLVAPEGYWLVSAIALGAGLGSIFSVGMTLIATTEPGESGTIALSGLAQGIGFTGGGLLAWAAGAGMATANPCFFLALLYTIFALSGLYFGLRCGKEGV